MTSNAGEGLVPSILQLNQGLDLTTPKLLAPTGSLFSCLNYEITDTQGMSRIDGLEKYDGWLSPATNTLLHVKVSGFSHAVGTTITTTSNATTLSYEDSIVGEVVAQKVITGTGAGFYYAIMVKNATYVNNTMLLFSNGSPPIDTAQAVYFGREFYDAVGKTEADYFTDLTAYHTLLRAKVVTMPAPICALHRFRNKQYLVAPTYVLKLRPWSGGARVNSATAWSLSASPGATLGNTINSGSAKVIDAVTSFYNGTYTELTVTVAITQPFTAAVAGFLTGTTVTHPAGAPDLAEIVSVTPVLGGNSDILYYIDNYGDYRGAKPVDMGYIGTFTTGKYSTEFPPMVDRRSGATPVTPTYYLTNGTTIYSATVTSIFTDSGSYVTGNAVGTIQFSNLTYVSGTTNVFPDSTWDVHTANPPTAPNKFGDLATFEYKYLPSEGLIETTHSKYEFVNANFYSDVNWDAMYGVNGYGRAFYYDGTYFAFIVTQTDTTKDNPRHIDVHALHLALGFGQGALQLSAAGEPWNFSGLYGASEFGYGDPITGLQEMRGTILGVFCQGSIHALSGTSVDNFSTQVLSPTSGCLEYTLADVGQPVFCNHSGITTLEQSEKYGNYVGQPLSSPVSNWLRPRLIKKNSRLTNSNVLGAMPVRAKNQYRLFFQDGMVLTMTLAADGTPQFTMQMYSTNGAALIPYCWSSVIDSDGTERKHLSLLDINTYFYTSYVYELDRGWGFDGQYIPHYFETNWVNNGNPTEFFTIRKARLHGVSEGRASLKIAVSGMQNLYSEEYHTTTEYADLPRNHVFFDENGFPSTNMTQLANRGLALKLKVEGRLSASLGDNPEPPHIVQLLVMQLTQGGKHDA